MANKVAFHKLSLGGNNSKMQHAMTVKPSPCNSAKIGVSSDVNCSDYGERRWPPRGALLLGGAQLQDLHAPSRRRKLSVLQYSAV